MRVWVTGARTILIVEDEPLIAMMLEDFLESLGHVVKASCDNVADALAAVGKNGFDIAILDVNLKGENVWPVATELRQRGVPFVLASGGHVEPPPRRIRRRAADRKALHDRPGDPGARSGDGAGSGERCASAASSHPRLLQLLPSAVAVAFLMIAAMQTQMLFPTGAVGPAGPLPAGAARVSLETPDGNTLHGVHIPPPAARKPAHADPRLRRQCLERLDVAVYLHQIFPQADVIVFHYRGYRPSTGSPSAKALLADAPLVHDFAVDRVKPDRTVAVGLTRATAKSWTSGASASNASAEGLPVEGR